MIDSCNSNDVKCAQILKKLQAIKWAKESALHEEDSVSDYGSVLNSVRRLDTLDAETPGSGSLPSSRPIAIPSRRSSGGMASSAPAGGLPPSASSFGVDGDIDCSTAAAIFSQSPIRALSPADVAEPDEEVDDEGLVAAADADDDDELGDLASPSSPAVDGTGVEDQALVPRRSSFRSKDTVGPLPSTVSRHETMDSGGGR